MEWFLIFLKPLPYLHCHISCISCHISHVCSQLSLITCPSKATKLSPHAQKQYIQVALCQTSEVKLLLCSLFAFTGLYWGIPWYISYKRPASKIGSVLFRATEFKVTRNTWNPICCFHNFCLGNRYVLPWWMQATQVHLSLQLTRALLQWLLVCLLLKSHLTWKPSQMRLINHNLRIHDRVFHSLQLLNDQRKLNLLDLIFSGRGSGS